MRDAVEAILAENRLRGLLMGGLSPTQVLDRLPADTRRSLENGAENPVIARRLATDAVVLALDELVAAGRARRGRMRLKNAIVDVYRLSLRG